MHGTLFIYVAHFLHYGNSKCFT